MRVTSREYDKDKAAFLMGHDWNKSTSPMIGNVYYSEYIRDDGRCFYECVQVRSENMATYAEIDGEKIFAGMQTVTYSKVEFWSDEDPRSKFYID